MCSAEHTPEVYIIPVTIPSPLALILIFQLLEHSSPTVAGVLVPTLFLHQMTAPSQGAHLPPPGKCACVFVCVCADGWPGSRSVQCPVVGRLLILALQQGEKFSLQPILKSSGRIPLSVIQWWSSSAGWRLVSTVNMFGTAISQADPGSYSPISQEKQIWRCKTEISNEFLQYKFWIACSLQSLLLWNDLF